MCGWNLMMRKERNLIAFTIFLQTVWLLAVAATFVSCRSRSLAFCIITNFHDGIRVSDDFRSKCKGISVFNLFASSHDSVFMDRFVEAIYTWTWPYAINSSSKAFTVTVEKEIKRGSTKKKIQLKRQKIIKDLGYIQLTASNIWISCSCTVYMMTHLLLLVQTCACEL